MKIRVRSGELNQVIQKDMLLKEWTQQDVLDCIKLALDKEPKKELQLSDLTSVAAVPFNREDVYYIGTKSALQQLGLLDISKQEGKK
jgi:hypothetical protein